MTKLTRIFKGKNHATVFFVKWITMWIVEFLSRVTPRSLHAFVTQVG